MLTSFAQKGCSSQVVMQLLVNGISLPIAQMGPDFLLIDKSVNSPACEATILFSVDDNEHHWRVQLPGGMTEGEERVAIARI